MDVDAGVRCQPVADLDPLVGGVFVHHQVQLNPVATVGVGTGDMLEEGQELLVTVPVLADAGDPAGGDLECREQCGGAVADVVVAALVGVAGLHRQRLLGPVQRLDLRLLVDTQHDRVLRGARYSPITSVTLATRSGSVENLNVSARHGVTPKARHAFNTVAWSSFSRDPSSRDDQCVTPSRTGGGVRVAAMLSRSSTRFGRPDRSPSTRPATPASRYRKRHRFTVGRETPTRSAISALRRPSEASSTIRARCARPAGTDDARTSRDNPA